MLGAPLVDGLYGRCPGEGQHTGRTGPKDFRVVLDGAPTGYCFHSHCGHLVDDFNKALRRQIWFAENGRDAVAPRGHWGADVAAEPKVQAPSRPVIDLERVKGFVSGTERIDAEWLRRRSELDPRGVDSGAFLDALFCPGERVLVFTSQRSQGDFLWVAGAEERLHGGWRLSQQRSTKAVRSALPKGSPDGVWYLVQPVSGQWDIVRESIQAARAGVEQQAKWTRRSQGNVVAWRHFVLEADELDLDLWLQVIVNLPMRIAAIYTSGKRSVHALARFEVPSKAEWDGVMRVLRQIVCPLGADPAALTAVRLSRLPGCKRGERLQELLYLAPNADDRPIRLLKEVR